MKLSLPQLKDVIYNYVDENEIASTSFSVTRNNVADLLDKIGKIFTIDAPFVDKLSVFDGEELSYGKTIEEWYQDLPLAQDYDANGANALSPTDPTYRPASYSYTLGRKKIPVTIRNNNLERAVHNAEQLSELLSTETKRMYDSYALFKYQAKKEIVAKMIGRANDEMSGTTTWSASTARNVNDLIANNGKHYIVVKKYNGTEGYTIAQAIANGVVVELNLTQEIAVPTDEATSDAFILQVKKDVEEASFATEGHSLNGNTVGIVEESLVLLVKKGVVPTIEVESLAGAFHEDKVAIPCEVIVVDDFGSDESGAYAVLCDRRAIRLHPTYTAVRENMNGDGDFLNLFLHTENTAFYSLNTFLKVYKEPQD